MPSRTPRLFCQCVFLFTILVFVRPTDFGTSVDYTELAREAESNKKDILGFLNQQKTREKYKKLYKALLNNLLSEYTNKFYF